MMIHRVSSSSYHGKVLCGRQLRNMSRNKHLNVLFLVCEIFHMSSRVTLCYKQLVTVTTSIRLHQLSVIDELEGCYQFTRGGKCR